MKCVDKKSGNSRRCVMCALGDTGGPRCVGSEIIDLLSMCVVERRMKLDSFLVAEPL